MSPETDIYQGARKEVIKMTHKNGEWSQYLGLQTLNTLAWDIKKAICNLHPKKLFQTSFQNFKIHTIIMIAFLSSRGRQTLRIPDIQIMLTTQINFCMPYTCIHRANQKGEKCIFVNTYICGVLYQHLKGSLKCQSCPLKRYSVKVN